MFLKEINKNKMKIKAKTIKFNSEKKKAKNDKSSKITKTANK